MLSLVGMLEDFSQATVPFVEAALTIFGVNSTLTGIAVAFLTHNRHWIIHS